MLKSFDKSKKICYSIIAFKRATNATNAKKCRSTQEAQGAPLLRE